jgi:hypothetical protein
MSNRRAAQRPTHPEVARRSPPSPGQLEIVRWTGSLGAVSAEALAERLDVSVASARARLSAAERAGWLARRRPLAGQPALYSATAAGLRACGARGLEPGKVSPSGALHLLACARVAAALEWSYPDYRVLGEREIRLLERELGRPLASAELGFGAHGELLLHRCDLVLWPAGPDAGLPVAVEVELTRKAPERLAAICRAWARCREVAGVLYLAPADVRSALTRAVERASAGDRVVVVDLDALPARREQRDGSRPRFVPSGA